MGKLSKVLGATAALATGYVKGDQLQKREEREQQDQQIRLADAAWQQRQRQRATDLDTALANDARPTEVQQGAGGLVKLDSADDRDVDGTPMTLDQAGGFRAAGRTFSDRASADKAAAEFNAPEAVVKRQALTLGQAGKPVDAMQLQRGAQQLAADQAEYARKAKTEGFHDAAFAMQMGDAQGVFDKFNKTGSIKLKDVPTVAERMVDVPGVGKVKTYDYTGTLVYPDGTEKQGTINSGEFNTRLLPYKDQVELARKGSDSDAKAQKMLSDVTNAMDKLRLQGEANAAKAEAARLKAAAGPQPPRGFRWKADGSGNLEPIPGGPGDKAAASKPMPPGAAKGYLENQTNLRRAEKALALASGKTVDGIAGDEEATGWKGMLPNQILNRIDEKGVDTRAAIADLGSLVIHDRSGAAVTAAEFPRLAPFIPTERDNQETVKKKLAQFVANYRAIHDDMREFYEASGYRVPALGEPKVTTPAAAPAAGELPRVTSLQEAKKLPRGSIFIGPDNKQHVVP